MNQPYRERLAVAPTFDDAAATDAFMNNRVRKGKLFPTEKAMLKNILKVGKLFINPQLAMVPTEGKAKAVLNPINSDQAISKKLKVTERQVKSIRTKMAELKIIELGLDRNGEKLRATGIRTLPCWLLSFEFMIDEDFLLKPNPEANTVPKFKVCTESIQRFLKIEFPTDRKLTSVYRSCYTRNGIEMRKHFEEDYASGAGAMTQENFNNIVQAATDAEISAEKAKAIHPGVVASNPSANIFPISGTEALECTDEVENTTFDIELDFFELEVALDDDRNSEAFAI